MCAVPALLCFLIFAATGAFGPPIALAQQPSFNPSQQAAQKTENPSLKVSLLLPDETPFRGKADVRVMPNEGYEVPGEPTEATGQFQFRDVAPGNYIVEVHAPGYLNVRISVEVAIGGEQKSVLVLMKPRPVQGPGELTLELEAPEYASKPEVKALRAPGERDFWSPHELEEFLPSVDPTVACPTQQVLHGVGQRASEFVSTLERFTAKEYVEHFAIQPGGERKGPETRKFTYMVAVAQNDQGTFSLEEFRNGTSDPNQFPGHVASLGLPAIDLVFHPVLASDFNFRCEGLGQWKGHPAWQVHFAQRPDQPVRIRVYVVNRKVFPAMLEGRAWIDPDTYQVMRLESELSAPIPEIELKLEHLTIDYRAVKFSSSVHELWLPQSAELYVDRQRKRYYRHHTFSDFELFGVDTAQKIEPPKGFYDITNSSSTDIVCELTVVPADGVKGQSVTLRFRVPAHRKVTKVVGLGKDVNLAPESVGSATLIHNGLAGSIRVEARLLNEPSVDVVARGPSGRL